MLSKQNMDGRVDGICDIGNVDGVFDCFNEGIDDGRCEGKIVVLTEGEYDDGR